MIGYPNIWAEQKDRFNNNIASLVGSGAPTNGTSGTGAGNFGPGSSYIDTVTGYAYRQVGTLASPVWRLAGGGVQIARALYDFSVDGGAIGLITPVINDTIPIKAIILGGIIDVVTTFTSGGSATISAGSSAGSSATSLKAATAVATYSAGLLAIVPVFTAATMVKLTAAGNITLTVAVAALTAGKAGIQVAYMIGD